MVFSSLSFVTVHPQFYLQSDAKIKTHHHSDSVNHTTDSKEAGRVSRAQHPLPKTSRSPLSHYLLNKIKQMEGQPTQLLHRGVGLFKLVTRHQRQTTTHQSCLV